jgi:voltage-gated potassium channel
VDLVALARFAYLFDARVIIVRTNTMDNTASQLPFRRFLPMVIALVVLPVAGTIGYRWIEDMNTLDALYMTITTISTVGFGEVKPLSPAGRIFTMGLIVSGVGLAAYSLSNLAHIIVTGEWRAHWEHRRQVRLLSKLTNHIIVCGYGRVGRRVDF